MIRIVLKVRALRATAAFSDNEAEIAAFSTKAAALAELHGIPAELLDFPGESLRVTMLMTELRQAQEAIAGYHASEDLWDTKSAEWSDLLDHYDALLEVAADELNLPIPVLPYGSRRHFRPAEREQIETLLYRRIEESSAFAARLDPHERANGEA